MILHLQLTVWKGSVKDSLKYAADSMRVAKEEMYTSSGLKKFKAIGKYFAYRDMVHYIQNKKDKQNEG